MSAAMSAAIVQAAATLVLAAALAVYVALRPARTSLRGPLLAVLACLMVWSAGVIWRFGAADDEGAFQGFLFGWLGIAGLPPFWFLLAARYARVPALERWPLLGAALFVPSAFAWLALATNDVHGLFLRGFAQEELVRGPLFYAWMGFAYPGVLAGLGLFVSAARRTFERDPRPRLLVAVAAALLPGVTSLLFVLDLLPVRHDPTPATLGVSVLVFTFGIFHMHFLDALPLARRDVIDHLREGVLITDPDGVVLDANPAALRTLGRSAREVRGRDLDVLLLEASRESRAARELAAAIAALPPDGSLSPAELRTPAGRLLEVGAKCLGGPGGPALGRVLVLRDRTDERQAERLLRQTQKLETVGSLAAGVAHEVNNPLAFVRANLHQIERLGSLAAKHADALAAVDPEASELVELPQIAAECLDGIERIARIVGAMRRFSRLPADELAPVDVNEAVHEAMRLADLHRHQGVTIEAWLAEDLPPIHGSAQRMTQVLLNLLVNAKQALADRDEGHVTVRTRRARDCVEIVVADDGPGVPEAIRDRIFDPFFTTKGPEEGTGLGLSIAFGIVREHGGVLALESGPHGGACFRALLPIQAHVDALTVAAGSA
jgi:PAS domain S-box-containing protein